MNEISIRLSLVATKVLISLSVLKATCERFIFPFYVLKIKPLMVSVGRITFYDEISRKRKSRRGKRHSAKFLSFVFQTSNLFTFTEGKTSQVF